MKNKMNYLERFGKKACKSMVWRAIPLKKRLLSFPFCASVYLDMFSNSSSLDELRVLHMECYDKSVVFRLLRPKFRKIKRSIRSLMAPTLDAGPEKTEEAHRPNLWVPQPSPETPSDSETLKLLYERVGQLSMQIELDRNDRDEPILEPDSGKVPIAIPIRQNLNVGT